MNNRSEKSIVKNANPPRETLSSLQIKRAKCNSCIERKKIVKDRGR